MGIRRFLLAVLLVTVLVMKDVHISSSSSSSSAVGNFTAGVNEEEEEEEFMMESEVNRRLLQGGGGKKITFKGLRVPRAPVCNAKRIGSCIPDPINEQKRACTTYERCSRNGIQ
ncbi:hypothetical protein LguiA_006277 [Lonicera macranthoides]